MAAAAAAAASPPPDAPGTEVDGVPEAQLAPEEELPDASAGGEMISGMFLDKATYTGSAMSKRITRTNGQLRRQRTGSCSTLEQKVRPTCILHAPALCAP